MYNNYNICEKSKVLYFRHIIYVRSITRSTAWCLPKLTFGLCWQEGELLCHSVQILQYIHAIVYILVYECHSIHSIYMPQYTYYIHAIIVYIAIMPQCIDTLVYTCHSLHTIVYKISNINAIMNLLLVCAGRRGSHIFIYYMYIHTYVYTYMCIHIHVQIYTCVYMYVYIFKPTFGLCWQEGKPYIYMLYVYTYICIYIHVYTYTCVDIYMCIYVCIYI